MLAALSHENVAASKRGTLNKYLVLEKIMITEK